MDSLKPLVTFPYDQLVHADSRAQTEDFIYRNDHTQ
jgi:hypothetical protein